MLVLHTILLMKLRVILVLEQLVHAGILSDSTLPAFSMSVFAFLARCSEYYQYVHHAGNAVYDFNKL